MNKKLPIDCKAVIFDMDGLMFDSERIGLKAFCIAAESHGYNDVEDFFLSLIGKTVHDADIAMKERFGFSFPIDSIRKERASYIEKIRNNPGIPMQPGLLELLKFLNINDIPTAVASSSSRIIVEKNLRQAKIMNNFHVLVGGDEITKGKPDPEIFLTAANKLQVNPTNCIVLEDSIPGILAAHYAGMIPIMIPDLIQPSVEVKQIAHRIFKSLYDVHEYLNTQ